MDLCIDRCLVIAFDDETYVANETTHKIEYSAERLRLHELYQFVRDARLKKDMSKIPAVWEELKENFSEDWLCALEILEITNDGDICKEIEAFLQKKAMNNKKYTKLIIDGLKLIT